MAGVRPVSAATSLKRELGILAGEGLEHPQPALQGRDEFSLRVFRHAKSPDYSVLWLNRCLGLPFWAQNLDTAVIEAYIFLRS